MSISSPHRTAAGARRRAAALLAGLPLLAPHARRLRPADGREGERRGGQPGRVLQAVRQLYTRASSSLPRSA